MRTAIVGAMVAVGLAFGTTGAEAAVPLVNVPCATAVATVVQGMGSIAELWWDSIEAMEAAFDTDLGRRAGADADEFSSVRIDPPLHDRACDHARALTSLAEGMRSRVDRAVEARHRTAGQRRSASPSRGG